MFFRVFFDVDYGNLVGFIFSLDATFSSKCISSKSKISPKVIPDFNALKRSFEMELRDGRMSMTNLRLHWWSEVGGRTNHTHRPEQVIVI